MVSLLGQISISGRAKDSDNKPVDRLTILIKDKEQIVAYGYTNPEGEFNIDINSESDSLVLHTRSLNYKNRTINIDNKTQYLDIDLETDVKEIEGVVVKGNPIYRKGDTIKYIVNSFANSDDRSIADVIRKMPGLDIGEDGAIYHQGKKIDKYYIEGLDLLGGQYSVANRNLPHVSVSAVEVLTNHQPIKVLKNDFYDGTSVNIKLKRKVVVTGTGRFGAGVSPFLRDVNITPMIFNKKQQIILSYQHNNIGNELKSQHEATIMSMLTNLGSFDFKRDNLEINQIRKPNINRRIYLDNDSHLFTYNQLFKLNKTLELKVNSSYYNDVSTEESQVNSTWILPESDVRIKERVVNKLHDNSLKAKLILTNNSSDRYIKNKLCLSRYWDYQKGFTDNNGEEVIHNADLPYTSVFNSLNMVLPVKNNHIKVNNSIDYDVGENKLTITPGAHQDILHSNISYKETVQNYFTKSLKTKTSAAYDLSFGAFGVESELGFIYNRENIETSIETDNNILTADSLNNDIYWGYYEGFIKETFKYKSDKLNVRLSVPVTKTYYDITSEYNSDIPGINSAFLSPGLYVGYDINSFFNVKAIAVYNRYQDSPDKLTEGYIISDYRNIMKNSSTLGTRESWRGQINLKYENVISGLFSDFSYSYQKTKRDLVFNINTYGNGLLQMEAMPYGNYSYNHSVTAGISYYIQNLQTTLSVKGIYTNTSRERLINKDIIEYKSDILTLKPSVIFDKFNLITLMYNYNLDYIKSNSFNNLTTFQHNHNINMAIRPILRHSLMLDFDYYMTKNSKEPRFETYFANVSYMFTTKKHGLRFKLRCSNIFDQKSFVKYYNNNVAQVENAYVIRPRHIVLSVYMELGKLLN
jgi:hypothetical protein